MFWRKKKKISDYRLFLRVINDCKKDKSLDESLERFLLVMPKYQDIFPLYYSRKLCRSQPILMKITEKTTTL